MRGGQSGSACGVSPFVLKLAFHHQFYCILGTYIAYTGTKNERAGKHASDACMYTCNDQLDVHELIVA